MKRERLFYFLGFIALLAIEFYIGIFVHDRFVRPYVGDVLVVIVLYTLVRTFSVKKPVWLSLWIFLFAIFVEITQIPPLVDVLGIKNHFLRVLMGTSFAWADILAYVVGSVVNLLLDLRIRKERG